MMGTYERDGKTYESKPVLHGSAVLSEMGKSRQYIDCPFCSESVLVYVWSLHGSGKRCPKCRCLLTAGSASREVKTNE